MSVGETYFNCTACGSQLKVASNTAGKRTICPACGATLIVPTPQPPPRDDPIFAAIEPERAPGAANTKFCFHCGAVISILAEICPRCGVRQPGTSPHGGSGPNRLVASLLAIFLGALGAHKFYLGDTTSGVIYLIISLGLGLCTLGISSLIIGLVALIEGLYYLSYTDEQFAAKYGRR
ncbi:TM2 domain-containing protein [Thermopirellula anaerolimosa]